MTFTTPKLVEHYIYSIDGGEIYISFEFDSFSIKF